MNAHELIGRLEGILEDHKFGVLSTISEEGGPVARWMTPILIPGADGAVYCLTSPNFKKSLGICKNPKLHWLLQDQDRNEVIGLKCEGRFIDNPSLKSQVTEKIGPNLSVFWGLNCNEEDCCVLECIIEEGEYFLPEQSKKEIISFNK